VTLQAAHRVVVVGGGFAGLLAARRLKHAHVQVTLVDRTANHVFQPLLYQYATGILSEGQIAPPLRRVLSRQRNVQVLLAEVTGFDLEHRVVSAADPDGVAIHLGYDSLIVAAGNRLSYFGHQEFARHAPGMKSIDDALQIRRRVFGAFEMAELSDDSQQRQEWLTFVVVGAGPTGCELAGQLRELATRTLRDEFRSIDTSCSRVLLFDAGEKPLATFGDRLSARAARTLGKLGVELGMGRVVTEVDAYGVLVKDNEVAQRVRARTVIWAAGVQASPLARVLAEAAGAETDRHGRITVLPDCSVPGHPEVFAVGDMMNHPDNLPGLAEVAMQSGVHTADTIRRRLQGRSQSKPFRYRDLGSMAYLSRGHAVVSFRGLEVGGFVGWLMWLVVHITFLTGYMNRLSALFTWLVALGGRRRSQRAISIADIRNAISGFQVQPAVQEETNRPTTDHLSLAANPSGEPPWQNRP